MANKSPGALPKKTAEMLEAAVLRAAITGQTNRDLAREFGVHYQTVQGIRRRLKKSGVLEPARKGRVSGSAANSSLLPGAVSTVGQNEKGEGLVPWRIGDMADFIKRLPNMRGLTDPEKINLLSHMALHEGGAPKVAAIKALADLEDTIAARSRVSLALPKTKAEKLERLRRMCEVVGESLWLEALELDRSRVLAIEEERRARSGAGGPTAGADPPIASPAPPLEVVELQVGEGERPFGGIEHPATVGGASPPDDVVEAAEPHNPENGIQDGGGLNATQEGL